MLPVWEILPQKNSDWDSWSELGRKLPSQFPSMWLELPELSRHTLRSKQMYTKKYTSLGQPQMYVKSQTKSVKKI